MDLAPWYSRSGQVSGKNIDIRRYLASELANPFVATSRLINGICEEYLFVLSFHGKLLLFLFFQKLQFAASGSS